MNETNKSILSDDKISFFNSLSSDNPTLPPVKSSLCVSLVYGVISFKCKSKLEK